jgi:hypothetical protein
VVAVEAHGRPVECTDTLDQALARAWSTLCRAYDVSAPLPELPELFAGVSFADPCHTAEIVLARMLLDVTESISRFSPWYTKPGRAFGLITMRDPVSSGLRHMLAPEAVQKWAGLLEPLAEAIQDNRGLIQAYLLVESLMASAPADEPYQTVRCTCEPPREFLIKPSIFSQKPIICTDCQTPFS